MNTTPQIILPQLVAAKTAARKNFQTPAYSVALEKEPRLEEMRWFVQWLSFQPGGIPAFCSAFLREFNGRLNTASMRAIDKPDAPYNPQERSSVITDFPRSYYGDKRAASAHVLTAWLTDFRGMTSEHAEQYPSIRRPVDPAFISRQNHPEFTAWCHRFAEAELPQLLYDFCTAPDAILPDVFWFHDLPGALFDAMDMHAARAQEKIANTQVARLVTEALDTALFGRAMVSVTGESRWGKSIAVESYCYSRPGVCRLVKTPCTNDERSFLVALADALGVPAGIGCTLREIRDAVQFVVKHCGLMFIFDEAHFLLPQSYGRRTIPVRLNYVRTAILDAGCPVALIQTPQHLDDADTYAKVSKYNMDQLDGRILRPVVLPNELPEDDLRAIIQLKQPGLPAPFVKRIMAAALSSPKGIFAIESVLVNARASARENGRSEIDLQDIETGLSRAGIALPGPPPGRVAAPRGNRKITSEPVQPRACFDAEAPARNRSVELEPV